MRKLPIYRWLAAGAVVLTLLGGASLKAFHKPHIPAPAIVHVVPTPIAQPAPPVVVAPQAAKQPVKRKAVKPAPVAPRKS